MPIQAPQWTDYLNCPVCCREFGPPPRSPVSLGCGHTLCRHCLKHLHRKQCPFDQTVIHLELEDLVTNTAVLQLAGYAPPAQPYHPPCVQVLSEHDRHAYDVIVRCLENLAVYLKYCGTATNNIASNRLSRPMQRKLITVIQCAMTDEEGRGRAARAARSLGERTVTELILQHQNPQQLSANLWAAVRARGCQFLGPAMQEEVLKLVLLALEDGSALSRKVLVMFVVQRLEPHFPQASKTSIGHVVQLLYRASCFKVSKRECDSSLMQLKEEFRSYESLRREHDAQIVQIATEAGLRIAPDQWSSLLYGDTAHKSHMQSIIDKLQTPASFAQSVQELFIALQRTGDPAQLAVLSMHLDRLANIDPAPDAKCPTWQQLAEIMTSLNEVVARLIHYLQHQATLRDANHNAKHLQQLAIDSNNQNTPGTGGSTPTHGRYKVSMCRDAAQRSFCPRGNACTFAHTEEELERFRSMPNTGPVVVNGNYNFMMPPMPSPMQAPMQAAMQAGAMQPALPMPQPAIFTRFPMTTHHALPDNFNLPPLASMPAQGAMPPSELIQNQEFENARNADSIQAQSYPAAILHSQPQPGLPGLSMNQNGGSVAGAGGGGPQDCFFVRYPPQFEAPNTSAQLFNPAVDGMPSPMPPGIVVNYANKDVEMQSFPFEDHPVEARQEMMPMYRMNTFPPQPQPMELHGESIWPPINNNMFKFDGMANALPRPNTNDDMFNVPADRRSATDRLTAVDINNMDDDQELEEELQALERRIDTEFKNTD